MAFIPSTPLSIRVPRTRAQNRRHKPAKAVLPKPLFDRILVRRDKDDQKSVGGLVLTGEKQQSKTGVVLDTGGGRYTSQGVVEDMPVEKGDQVFWKDEYGAEEIPGEDDVVLLRVFSIAGKF